MKIQLKYDQPSQLQTDLLVVILDGATTFHNLSGSPLDEMVRRIRKDFQEKRLKKEYFTALDSKSPVKNILVYSTSLSPAWNVWENLKIFIAQSIRFAQNYSLNRISILLNSEEAVPFI